MMAAPGELTTTEKQASERGRQSLRVRRSGGSIISKQISSKIATAAGSTCWNGRHAYQREKLGKVGWSMLVKDAAQELLGTALDDYGWLPGRGSRW